MPHQPEDNTLEDWHRYFAMEANNRAWSLAVEDRGSEKDQELLSAAEASLHHWSKVGTDLHIHRARMLVAEAHALVGLGPTALRHAQAVATFFETIDTPDWEEAYVVTILAHAAKVAGNQPLFEETLPKAQRLVDSISDPEDKAIVQRTFDQIA